MMRKLFSLLKRLVTCMFLAGVGGFISWLSYGWIRQGIVEKTFDICPKGAGHCYQISYAQDHATFISHMAIAVVLFCFGLGIVLVALATFFSKGESEGGKL